MRNCKYIMAVLCLCFLGKAQAQGARWTSEQVDKAKSEVKLIHEVITLTEDQKVLLTDILVVKDRSLERRSKLSTSRRNWNTEVFLKRIEDVVRYGREIDRNPNQPQSLKTTQPQSLITNQQQSLKANQELLSKEQYTEKLLNNEKLRRALGLDIIYE